MLDTSLLTVGVRRKVSLGVLVAGIALLSGCDSMRTLPPRPVAHAPPPAVQDTQVYVYPRNAQAANQVDRDRYECHTWAVKQSNFDPSAAHVAPHERVQVVAMPAQGSDVAAGAATGAVLGAIVSRPHDAGAGAIIGAIAGAAVGAASESSQQQQAASMQRARDERDQQAAADREQAASAYRRAISACLEGRGYTVK